MMLTGIRPYIYGGIAVIVAIALWLAYNQGRINEREDWEKAQQKEMVARAAKQAENDKETNRRLVAQKEIAENAVQERDAARNDADAAADAGERLRKQIANLTVSLAASGARTPAAGEATGQAADLLDGVFQRLTEAENGIARYADEASIAGKACEASYGALLLDRSAEK